MLFVSAIFAAAHGHRGSVSSRVEGALDLDQPRRARHDARLRLKDIQGLPGSTLGRVRYGRADFNFQLCGGDAGNSFKTRASVMTNATGENLGFFVSNPQVVATDVFANTAIFVASFHSKTCTPRLGWPCWGSGDWKVKYGVSSMTQRPRAAPVPDVNFAEFSRSTPDHGYTLYNTP